MNKKYMDSIEKAYWKSPVGVLEIKANEKAILSVDFQEDKFKTPSSEQEMSGDKKTLELLQNCISQLKEYFEGKRKEFSVPLQYEGSEFQKKVWNQLLLVPYGQTISYKKLAELIGNEKAMRAVGNANGKNKIAILLPCHRVIQADGRIGGYAGGVERKQWLLEHEKKYSTRK